MDFININTVEEIPKVGKVAVAVLIDLRAPCKKFINTARQSIGILENPKAPAGGSYYLLPLNETTKALLGVRSMPTTIVYVNGVEKKRFVGHCYGSFEIAEMITEGFNK